jgi:hypothetical protein
LKPIRLALRKSDHIDVEEKKVVKLSKTNIQYFSGIFLGVLLSHVAYGEMRTVPHAFDKSKWSSDAVVGGYLGCLAKVPQAQNQSKNYRFTLCSCLADWLRLQKASDHPATDMPKNIQNACLSYSQTESRYQDQHTVASTDRDHFDTSDLDSDAVFVGVTSCYGGIKKSGKKMNPRIARAYCSCMTDVMRRRGTDTSLQNIIDCGAWAAKIGPKLLDPPPEMFYP